MSQMRPSRTSTAPFYIRGARFGVGNGNGVFVDPNVESQPKSQPQSIYGTFNMIQTADNVAAKYGVSREECDAFALSSQHKAVAAIDAGRFKDEITPVYVPRRKAEPLCFDTDEYPKRDTNAEKMAKLRPIFEGGVTTAGNASGRNDGAVGLMLMSAEKAKELGVEPLATWVAGALAGVEPEVMGLGPIAATKKVMAKTGLTVDDMDLIEANEAFAAQSVAVGQALHFDQAKLNVNGGAIALGHPVGASGARILVTLLYAMKHRGAHKGLATLCIGGGMGCATIVEM